jgi:hypothetical protein
MKATLLNEYETQVHFHKVYKMSNHPQSPYMNSTVDSKRSFDLLVSDWGLRNGMSFKYYAPDNEWANTIYWCTFSDGSISQQQFSDSLVELVQRYLKRIGNENTNTCLEDVIDLGMTKSVLEGVIRILREDLLHEERIVEVTARPRVRVTKEKRALGW